MTVPILQQGNLLIAVAQTDLNDVDLRELAEKLALRVSQSNILVVIIDVSVVDVLDSYASRIFNNIGMALKLCGANTIISGISPQIAFSMARVGLELQGVHIAFDLEQGIAMAQEFAGRRQLHGE